MKKAGITGLDKTNAFYLLLGFGLGVLLPRFVPDFFPVFLLGAFLTLVFAIAWFFINGTLKLSTFVKHFLMPLVISNIRRVFQITYDSIIL
jgi:hypothetical protein